MTRPGEGNRFAEVEMPEWMREQARREAGGSAQPASRPDRPEEFAARLAEIRARAHAEALTDDGRRDQLTRWHHDDQAADEATTEDAYRAGYLDGLGDQSHAGDPAGEEWDR